MDCQPNFKFIILCYENLYHMNKDIIQYSRIIHSSFFPKGVTYQKTNGQVQGKSYQLAAKERCVRVGHC
jgi:hypothetical protein